MKEGIDDQSYESIFKPIIREIMEVYSPSAIVLQCGADSLSGDRLGQFNLSSKGHGACVEFVSSFNVPLLVLGGGGYTIRNVARAWCYETAILLNEHTDLCEELPYNDYIDYYGPDFKLHIPQTNMENLNSRDYLEKYRNKILENIRRIGRPNVPSYDLPPENYNSDEENEENPDIQRNQRDIDQKITRDDELSDSEDEDDRRNVEVDVDMSPNNSQFRTQYQGKSNQYFDQRHPENEKSESVSIQIESKTELPQEIEDQERDTHLESKS